MPKEDLVNIVDIGEILAVNIYDYFRDVDNLELINKLKELGINMEYISGESKEDERITHKKFVITGTISFMGRDEIKKIIEKYDGSAIGSVSKKTDVVIVGENPGSKYDKAKSLGITIWDEEDLRNILTELGELEEN